MKTRGQMEAEISEAMIRWEKDYMGRGPTAARTYIVEDMVIVRLQGVITRAEQHLATSAPGERGRDLIKQTRSELIESARPMLEEAIYSTIGIGVKSMHTDISTSTGERVIIFTLEGVPVGTEA